MVSFTNGTAEMVHAMVEADKADMESFPMVLNHGDMEALIWVMSTTVGFVSLEDIPEDIRERAESLFTGIAETLGIEGI
jgi:hypothetical protein